MTIDASNRYGLAAATLTKYYNGDHNQDAAAPLHTITTRDREGVTVANLSKFYGGVVGAAASDPGAGGGPAKLAKNSGGLE